MRGAWQSVNGYWYYFDVNGTMLTGWQKPANDWYYLYDTGGNGGRMGQRSMVSGIISGHLRKMGIYREPWLMEAGKS